ncbi:sulfatase-like hydrolase/transferase, partial [bacterium]|nr:sulfatase-like hydrolase/transferase [bacterium]
SLFTGRFGIHTGIINHGGVAAEPFNEGSSRGFRQQLDVTCWMRQLRNAGLTTVSISTFAERHSAWWFTAGFNETHNVGLGGHESAEEVTPLALDWLRRHGRSDNWFLHVHYWDPHTPYRAPAEFGNPFANDPLPSWYTDELRREHWSRPGPHSAQEIRGYDAAAAPDPRWPRQPVAADSLAAARQMFDGYDTGIRYADHHAGLVLATLAEAGVADDTVIIISSDHGETLGELNVYGDHQLADSITCRVPLIVRWPGVTDRQAGRVDPGLLHPNDFAATMVELLGGRVPDNWDGQAFTGAFRGGQSAGRDWLVVSQGAWSCQRGVRFGDYHFLRSYHDGYHGLPEVMLFDLAQDPHELIDIAPSRPEHVQRGGALLEAWHAQMMRTATHPVDPMGTVLGEGGPLHTRGQLPKYLERLRATGRAPWADHLAEAHPREC